jgi:hypothetical protein
MQCWLESMQLAAAGVHRPAVIDISLSDTVILTDYSMTNQCSARRRHGTYSAAEAAPRSLLSACGGNGQLKEVPERKSES